MNCEKNNKGTFQPYPKHGEIKVNETIQQLTGQFSEDDLYLYVVTTVDHEGDKIVHTGSAPNFQGGKITLCTCKHDMRGKQSVKDWRGIWVAGLGSKDELNEQAQPLLYLMRVETSYRSQREMWNKEKEIRDAKSASKSIFGDIYQPKTQEGDPHNPDNYHPPILGHAHRDKGCDTDWHKDIEKEQAYLVGDPSYSYLWTQPMYYYSETIFVGHKPTTLGQFIDNLSNRLNE